MATKRGFSFREVVTAPKPEGPIRMSWNAAVSMFYYHLLTLLLKQGVGIMDAYDKLTIAKQERSVEIEELLTTVTQEDTERTGVQIIIEG